MEDIRENGNYKTDVYKGVKWEIKRHPNNNYLCGYVCYDDENYDGYVRLSNEKMEELEGIAHGGLTADLGFDCDCAHYMDYYCGNYEDIEEIKLFPQKSLYRDCDYVLGVLERMIDCILPKMVKAAKN